MQAGQLEIVLLANMARLQSDMDQAKRSVGGAMASIEKSVAQAKAALGALGATLSAGYFVSLINGAINAADHLNDLSKSTNIAVEDLAGLKLLAKQTGTDLDGLAKGINKMSVEMGKDPEKFRALGITATSNAEAFKQFADVFNLLPDIQQRNALAQAVFSKSWIELAPALSEGGAKIGEIIEKGARLSGVTKEMAQAADEFNDKWAELTGTGGLLNRQVASLLPLLNVMADNMLAVQGATHGLSASFNPFTETLRAVIVLGGNVAFVFKGVGREIGGIAAQLVAFGSGDFRGALRIGEMMKEDAVKARAAFDLWENKIMTTTQATAALGDTTDALSRKLGASERAAKSAAAALATARAKAFLNTDKPVIAAAIDPQIKAYADLVASIREKIAANLQEIEVGRKLTDSEKQILDIQKLVEKGSISATDASSSKTLALLAEFKVSENLRLTNTARLDAEKALKDAEYARIETLEKSLPGMADANKALTEEIELIGLSELAQLAITQARLGSIIAIKEEQVARMNNAEFMSRDQIALEEEIRLLKERQNLQGVRADVTATRANERAYKDAEVAAKSYIDTINKQAARAVSGIGKGAAFRAEQSGLNVIEDKQTTQRQGLEGDLRRDQITSAQFNLYLGIVNETYAKEVAIYEKSRDDIKAAQADWTNGMTEAGANYLTNISEVAKSTETLFSQSFKGMEDALTNFVMTGKLNFESLVNSMISGMIRITIQQSIMKPMLGMMGLTGFANGGAFDQGGATAFANGGTFTNQLVNQPTPFRFASGGSFKHGVMGEAGPEAVMPLSRGSDGKLGVKSSGGQQQTINVTYNMTVGDVASASMVRQAIAGSERRIAAGIGRSMQYGGAMA